MKCSKWSQNVCNSNWQLIYEYVFMYNYIIKQNIEIYVTYMLHNIMIHKVLPINTTIYLICHPILVISSIRHYFTRIITYRWYTFLITTILGTYDIMYIISNIYKPHYNKPVIIMMLMIIHYHRNFYILQFA